MGNQRKELFVIQVDFCRSVLENFLDTHAFVVAPPREILELRRCRVRAQHRAREGIPFSACENVTAAGMGVD